MSLLLKAHIYKRNGQWYCQAHRPSSYHSSGYTALLGPGRYIPQLAYRGWYEWHWAYLPSQPK